MLFFEFYQSISIKTLKKVPGSFKEILLFFAEFFFNTVVNLGNIPLAIDTPPDKASYFVKVDMRKVWFIKKLLCYFIEDALVFYIDSNESLFILAEFQIFINKRNYFGIIDFHFCVLSKVNILVKTG